VNNQKLRNLFQGLLDVHDWKLVAQKDNYAYDGVSIPGLHQDVYQKEDGNRLLSVGIFSYKGQKAYLAWGYADEPHCSFHALLSEDSHVQEVRDGCPHVISVKNKTGEVGGFVLDRQERFTASKDVQMNESSDTHCAHCGVVETIRPSLLSRITSTLQLYMPLIIVFVLITAWTGVHQSIIGFNLHFAMHDFMGGFFLIFGFLKIINWKKFALSFKVYDPFAARSTIYAYLYPLIEIVLGVAYQFRLQPEIIFNITTVVILTASSIGVVRSLREKNAVTCACLGGFFNIPISWVTVAENALMIFMAIFMQIVYGSI